MPSELKSRLTEAMKSAMKAQEKATLGTIRLMLAALKQKEVDERIELSDAQIVDILTKMVKQRKDAITQYQAANRPELADKEQAEIAVIEGFLPAPMNIDEIKTLVQAAITQTQASTTKDMGKVMGALKPQLAGRADMGEVGALVRDLLQ